MVQVWNSYLSDLGRVYPMFALSISQLNDVDSTIDPISLLPSIILPRLINVDNPCGVRELTPRYLVLFASDGGQFRLSYPLPFDQGLRDDLTANTDVAAFEFVGERIKYGRLRRLLENV